MNSTTQPQDTREKTPCACVVDLPKHKGGRIYMERCALHEAAPDLLEALERLLEEHSLIGGDHARRVAAGRAAIEKARAS